jgi:phage shock protein C
MRRYRDTNHAYHSHAHHSRYNDYRRPQLQLDPRHGKVCGVCAGIARYLGVQRVFVRIAAVIALLCITTPTLIAYAVTYLLLDRDR